MTARPARAAIATVLRAAVIATLLITGGTIQAQPAADAGVEDASHENDGPTGSDGSDASNGRGGTQAVAAPVADAGTVDASSRAADAATAAAPAEAVLEAVLGIQVL
ncbi:MAG: hypothetical protein ABUS79_15115, partial [Pseudomonadota bacterium]